MGVYIDLVVPMQVEATESKRYKSIADPDNRTVDTVLRRLLQIVVGVRGKARIQGAPIRSAADTIAVQLAERLQRYLEYLSVQTAQVLEEERQLVVASPRGAHPR